MSIGSGVLYSAGWTANFIRKSNEKPSKLEGKFLKKPERYNLLIRDIFNDLSSVERKGKTSLEFFELHHFTDSLQALKIFSNTHYTTKNGFYLLTSLEEACKNQNGALAALLIEIGVPITFQAIDMAIKSNLWSALKNKLAPVIIKILARGGDTSRDIISLIFDLKDQEILLDLIDEGLPLYTSCRGETLLHIAAKNGFSALAARLVSENAVHFTGDISPLNSLGKECQDVEEWFNVFQILYAHVDFKTAQVDHLFYELIVRLDKHYPQYKSPQRKDGEKFVLKIFQEILKKVTDKQKSQLVEYKKENKQTVLFKAANLGFEEISIFLCKEGGYYPFAKKLTSSGTILHVAIDIGLNDLSNTLLDILRDSNKEVKTKILEIKDSNSLTVLLLALKEGNHDIAIRLMEEGASQTEKDDAGWGCVHFALLGGLLPLLKQKIHEGKWKFTKESLNLEDEYNCNIGHSCSFEKRFDSVLWLLENGLEIEKRSDVGETILDLAIDNACLPVILKIEEMREKYPLEIDLQGNLATALLPRNWDIVQWLLKKGAKKEGIKFFETSTFWAQAELKEWKSLWGWAPEEMKESLRGGDVFFLTVESIREEFQSKDRERIEFFLENNFSLTASLKDLKSWNFIREWPLDTKRRILEKIFAEISRGGERFKSKEDFLIFFEEEIGDLTLKVSVGENVQFMQVSKQILANSSDFFHKKFLGPMAKDRDVLILSEDPLSQENAKEYFLAFEEIVRYFYSKRMDVTFDNFKILVKLADRYGLGDIKKILEKWVEEHPAFDSWRRFLNPYAQKISREEKDDGRETKKRKVEN